MGRYYLKGKELKAIKKDHPDIDGWAVLRIEDTWSCGPITDIEDLRDGLKVASGRLEKIQYFFDEYQDRISQIKEGVDVVEGSLSKLINVCGKIAAVHKIDAGVSALIRIGDIQNDPEGTALAFGQVLSGVGELADVLPFPASSYVGILKGSEHFFINLLKKIDPATRGTNQRESNRWRQGDVIIPGFGDKGM